jgi:hypothetical protein
MGHVTRWRQDGALLRGSRAAAGIALAVAPPRNARERFTDIPLSESAFGSAGFAAQPVRVDHLCLCNGPALHASGRDLLAATRESADSP